MGVSSLPAYNPYNPSVAIYLAKAIDRLDAQWADAQQSVDRLQQSSASFEIKISDYGRIQSDLAALESAAQSLSGPTAFFRYSAKSSDSRVLSAYMQGSALPGTYNVEVSQLAQGETLVSAAQRDPFAPIGNGSPATVTFRFRNGASENIAINGSNDSLSSIAASINRAGIGISAMAIFDGSAFRLVIKGPEGAANTFNIGVSGDDALSRLLSYSGGASNNAMSLSMAAQDSQGSVNGTPFSGDSNVLMNVAEGLTLSLSGIGSTAVTVSTDLLRISDAVRSFVDAYNVAQGDIAASLTGELPGDRTLAGVSDQLSSDLAAWQSGQGTSSNGLLAQIGITRNQDGTLSFDVKAFQEAYSRDPAGVAHIFTDNGNGLAEQIANQIQSVIQPGGNISMIINQLLSQIQGNQQMENRMQDSAIQDLQHSAHRYAQQLALMIIRQIIDQFMKSMPHPPNQYSAEIAGILFPQDLTGATQLV